MPDKSTPRLPKNPSLQTDTVRSFGPFRGQIVELSMVDHEDEPLPDGMAAVTILMPIADARVAASAMFLWGDFIVRVTTEPPKAEEIDDA